MTNSNDRHAPTGPEHANNKAWFPTDYDAENDCPRCWGYGVVDDLDADDNPAGYRICQRCNGTGFRERNP